MYKTAADCGLVRPPVTVQVPAPTPLELAPTNETQQMLSFFRFVPLSPERVQEMVAAIDACLRTQNVRSAGSAGAWLGVEPPLLVQCEPWKRVILGQKAAGSTSTFG